jgi:glycosyltransferase involved in cell wall biosynthesis
MNFNPERWAVVAHNDDTGFGRQAADLKTTLGVGWHFVIPSERLENKPLKNEQEIILPKEAPREEVARLFSKVDGIIYFERPNWHPEMLPVARELGIRNLCCPNWEWFRGHDPLWKLCDLFVTTSSIARNTLEKYGFKNHADIGPWCLDIEGLPHRKIDGPAKLFVHNAGIVDPQDRKATFDTIRAFSRTCSQDIRLLVRMQKEVELPKVDERIEISIGNLENPADLYKTGDVAVQPSKMEGNGFMVLEPLMCGIPTITLDYPPMNEYVPQAEMCCRKKPFKRKAFPTPWVKHAHLRLPSIRDLAKKIDWCATNDLGPISRENRAWAEREFSHSRIKERWEQALRTL